MIYKVISVLTKTPKYTYTIITIFALLFVLLTNPFLRYPYDIFAHLIAIDELYNGATYTTTSIQHNRLLWHDIWATLFHFFNIDSQQLFLRAKIIYTIQTSITLLSIYYFSHVIFRNLFKNIHTNALLYLSLWSTIIWFTIYATHSVHYNLVWNLWYSVNYQITLALFWYMTGLTLVLILEETSWQKKLFFIFQLLLLARFIIQIHSMELMYYFMYISLLSLIYIDKLYVILKKYYFIFIIAFIVIIYSIKKYIAESSKIFKYLNTEKFPLLYDDIFKIGKNIIEHLNRANSGSLNELMSLVFYFSLFMLVFFIWQSSKNKKIVDYRILIFIFLSASFIFIPLNQFSGGLFALIARPDVVHRMYYSSSIFLLLPLFIYYLLTTYHISLKYLNIIIILILVSTFLFSKYNTDASHYFYKNIQSIQNSFYPNTYHFHLSSEQIKVIGQKIKSYEEKNNSTQKIYYYARADIAFVIKYIYHKDVLWEGRRANPDYIKHYHNDTKSTIYHKVLFETPKMFPRYTPFK